MAATKYDHIILVKKINARRRWGKEGVELTTWAPGKERRLLKSVLKLCKKQNGHFMKE